MAKIASRALNLISAGIIMISGISFTAWAGSPTKTDVVENQRSIASETTPALPDAASTTPPDKSPTAAASPTKDKRTVELKENSSLNWRQMGGIDVIR
jgi:hypothetical protein